MDEDFIRNRITELRLEKGVSEYKMSLELGHSKGYIQGISSGRALPSMSEFLYICKYFNITPKEFFDTETKYPLLLHDAVDALSHLDGSTLRALQPLLTQLYGKKK